MAQQKYSTSGVLHAILDPETRGTFTSQKAVLEVEGYGNKLEYAVFEFGGKSLEFLGKRRVGDLVTVHWELRGREHKGKFYSNLSAWKIEGEQSSDRGFSRPEERPTQQPARDYKLTDDRRKQPANPEEEYDF